MRKFAFTAPLLFGLWLSSCVTINIYFPAAAAEQAADEIIKGIQGDKKEADDQHANSNAWQSYNIILFAGNLLDYVIPLAPATEANLSIDSAEIRQIRASMKNRYEKLKPFYDGGFIGIQSDGLIAVRNRLPLQDKSRGSKWVAAENSDRGKLYRAIANANGHPEWARDIKATFARRWVSNAHPGWWYQSGDGSWRQK